ncbi:MAG: helix-turn-helix transcriptional regulator [Anaerolineae bacterium]|nr:helix-turn-helix transcriptional regulator [Anaerolineae bacterium]
MSTQNTAVHPASPLPHLGLLLASPSPALAPYVHSYWFINRSWTRPLPLEEYLYPEGGLGVVFNSGDPIMVDGTAVTAPAFLDATNSFRTRLGFQQHTAVVGIRFHPGGAYPFFPMPLKELQNMPVALDQILPSALASQSEQLAALPTLPQKIAHLEYMLWQWQKPQRELATDTRTILAAIRQAQGQVNIKSLADARFISQRQLERLFQAQVGMSAKTYARLVRVQRARTALRQATPAAAHLSQDLGFYDQSHFIHEFRAIMGLTPQQYRQNRALRQQNRPAERLNQEDRA